MTSYLDSGIIDLGCIDSICPDQCPSSQARYFSNDDIWTFFENPVKVTCSINNIQSTSLGTKNI